MPAACRQTCKLACLRDGPERGWYRYGACRRGGTIYDLAAPLYGYTDRGEDFLRLRAELRRLFGLEPA